MPTSGASGIRRLESNGWETSAMLATLGFFLLGMLISCTMALLICWVYDTDRAEIEADRSRSADLPFVSYTTSDEWQPYFTSMVDLGFWDKNCHAV
jgi:hypothetical protein